jgi:uncharacterized protein YbjQ (UPF0145 family)
MDFLNLIIFVVLLGLGYGIGRHQEASHYRSILSREKQLQPLLIVQSRYPPQLDPPPRSQLVTGSVVISVDFFKVFVAGLRSLIGGRLTSYESLLDRARREAVLRMKEEAHALGANMVVNVKFESVSLYKEQHNAVQSVEAMAYGTALIPVRR